MKEKDLIHKPTGMRAFMIVWFGRLISIIGSVMTGFALMIWIWAQTGEATPFAIFGFCYFAPLLISTPLAGALVDRWNRKFSMMLGDLGAGASTVAIFILMTTGHLQIWHLYITGIFGGFFAAFQFPAFTASISLMLSKKDYARASGLMSMADTGSNLAGPILAAMLIGIIGIKGIMMIDIITFSAAVVTLLIVHIPQPEKKADFEKGLKNIWSEITYGFKYIYARRSLLGILLFFLMINIFFTMGNTIRTPMILARSGGNEMVLAGVQMIAAVGGVAGGALLAVWGGPKRRIRGIFLCIAISSIIGGTLMGIGRGLILWGVGSFVFSFFMVISGGCSQSFWQSKVEPAVQGKVFAARRFIAQLAIPMATLISGPLSDRVFEPGMTEGGTMTALFGDLIGTGSGAGMALIFFFTGIIGLMISVIVYWSTNIREAEDILPDHDHVDSPATPQGS